MRPPRYEFNCKTCGELVVVKNHLRDVAKYCSRKCKNADHPPLPVHECETCGLKFTRPNQPNRMYRYCSRACFGKSYRGAGQGKTVAKCEWCSEPFLVWPYEARAGRKLCSKECAVRFKDEGKTTEAIRLRTSTAYARWRTAVFDRDDYTCQDCGQRGGKLNADHIKRFSDHPELRLSVDNGRTLCEPCHKKTPTFGRRKRVDVTAVGLEA